MTERIKCIHCDGCGQTDSNEDEFEQAPWTFWTSLPPGSDVAVRMGFVRPQTCVRCNGAGTVEVTR